MRLKLERFDLPNKPSETPAPVWAMVRNRKISHAEHRNLLKEGFGAETGEGRLPFPLPLIRRQPLSPARRRTAPLTQGSHKAAAAANGEETGERCGVRRVSEANLKHERFGRKSTVCSDGGREAAEAGAFGGANKPGGTPAHRRWVGAQQGGRGAAEGRVFWRKEHSVLFSEKKPTGTPEHPKGMIRCAARGERYSPMMFLRVSARGRDLAGRSEASRSVQPAESSRSAASVSLPEVSVR